MCDICFQHLTVTSEPAARVVSIRILNYSALGDRAFSLRLLLLSGSDCLLHILLVRWYGSPRHRRRRDGHELSLSWHLDQQIESDPSPSRERSTKSIDSTAVGALSPLQYYLTISAIPKTDFVCGDHSSSCFVTPHSSTETILAPLVTSPLIIDIRNASTNTTFLQKVTFFFRRRHGLNFFLFNY